VLKRERELPFLLPTAFSLRRSRARENPVKKGRNPSAQICYCARRKIHQESDSAMSEQDLSAVHRAKLNLETAQMAWRDMQRYFASGIALYVAPELDLVEVGWHMSQDHAAQIQGWMATQQFGKVRDEQATTWFANDALLWTVVVSPWVLVQPVK
jgi:hypothetical protein